MYRCIIECSSALTNALFRLIGWKSCKICLEKEKVTCIIVNILDSVET